MVVGPSENKGVCVCALVKDTGAIVGCVTTWQVCIYRSTVDDQAGLDRCPLAAGDRIFS